MDLRRLQQNFKDALLTGETACLSDALCQQDEGGMSKQEQVAVYRNNMIGGLTNTLKQIYPACRRHLTDEHFLPAARGYIATHPSTHYDLNFYGAGFAQFIQQLSADYAAISDRPYLPELAHLEWLCHSAYYAQDDGAFDFAAFERAAADQPDTIRFVPSNSLALLSSCYSLKQIRETSGDLSQSLVSPLTDATKHLCISRRKWEVAVDEINAEVYHLITAVLNNNSLENLSARCAQIDRHLPELVRKKWLCGFVVK